MVGSAAGLGTVSVEGEGEMNIDCGLRGWASLLDGVD